MDPPHDDDGHHDDDHGLRFRTILEYCGARAYARRLVDDDYDGRCFSRHKVFVNNGDTYNAKHIIRRFVEDAAPAAQSSGLATPTGGRHETFLDRPSAARTEYLRRAVDETSRDGDDDRDADEEAGDAPVTTVLTTLRGRRSPGGGGGPVPPSGCRTVAKDGGGAWLSALMRCAAAVFDVTDGGGGADDEVRDARAAFVHVHDELMKCSDEQLARWRDDGTVRCFVLVSTAMTWAEEPRPDGDGYFDDSGEEEERPPHDGAEETWAAGPTVAVAKNALGRAPVSDRYRTVFELEKSVLRANSTRTRHVFRGRVIGVGVTYGHEQRALRHVFERAWLGDDHDDVDEVAYAALGRRTVPAVHVDQLAELVRVTCARGRRPGPLVEDRAYALAVERPSYEFADIVDAVRDAFCTRRRAADRDRRADKRRLRTVYDIFENNDGRQQLHGHRDGRPVTNVPDGDRYGLGSGFALDLILSDLDADHPALQDFIAAPAGRYQTSSSSSLVPDARRLAREYVAARGLRPFRVLVSGRPRRVAARVAARLARRYRVPLVDAGRAIDDRADRLRTELDGRASAAVVTADEEWTGDESAVDGESTAAVYAYASENERAEESFREDDDGVGSSGGHDDELQRRYAIGIHDIQRALADLNAEREHLGRSIDPVHLLPLIRESLSTCSCRNRGYVMDVFPLSVERMDVIFDGEVDYPNAVVMLSYDSDDPDEIMTGSTAVVNDDDDEGSQRRSSRDHCRIDLDSESSETDSSDGYSDRRDDCREIDDDCAEENSNEKNNHRYDDTAELKRVVKYFTEKRSKILSLKIPFGLIDETGPNDWQYTSFTESIVTQVGRPLFADEDYETTATDIRQTITAKNNSKKTKTMSRTVLKKLRAMREEWNNDIFKAIERDKLHKYDKDAKIKNYVNTNILQKLLKEVSPIGNEGIHSVSWFPEISLKKTTLRRTRPDED